MLTGPDFVLVFVHGWSVTDVETYGMLPFRLRDEIIQRQLSVHIENIYLGEYISFHDEVRVGDISRAFHRAINEVKSKYPKQKLICITHSTGGPVVRTWWYTYYKGFVNECPVSHLIMLAPANFGSPLAKLGKKTISRFLAEIKQVDPGVGVLQWLEQGSKESLDLNADWIFSDDSEIGGSQIFPFVITGDYIDRSVISHLIPFTHELGSDGVVRASSANLNCGYVEVSQIAEPSGGFLNVSEKADVLKFALAPRTPFLVVPERSHSGTRMGIMNSVGVLRDPKNQPTVDAILECMAVQSNNEYLELAEKFETRTDDNQKAEIKERVVWFDPVNRSGNGFYIHDRYSMIIFRVRDKEGYPIPDYDMTFTAGPEGSANNLPPGFMGREQKNDTNKGVITFYLNFDILHGTQVVEDNGKVIREAQPGIGSLGFNIYPYPGSGFVSYAPLFVNPTKELLHSLVRKNSTTIVDVVFHRLVAKETFEFNELNAYSIHRRTGKIQRSFKDKQPGSDAVE